MSWLSSAWNGIKNVGNKVGSVVKKVATPVLSFAASLVPGVGPLLSKGVDTLGNTLMGDADDSTSPAAQAMASPAAQYMASTTGLAVGLGSSPAAQAMASATAQSEEEGGSGWLARVTGIGDHKPGVFGIGTGKNKVRKQAEDAARGEGLSPKAVKLAGEEAVYNIPAKVSGTNKPGGSGEASVAIPLIGGIIALLLAL